MAGAGTFQAIYRSAAGQITTLAADDDGALRAALADEGGVLWIDLLIHEPDDGRILGDVFRFHPLSIEDAVQERVDPAKIDDYDDYLFIVVQAVTGYEMHSPITSVEVDFYLGPNYVVSCHRYDVPALANAIDRHCRGDQLLHHRADWLLHSLLDALVDDYLPIVDAVDETIDDLEAEVLKRASTDTLEQIMMVKRNSLRLRRATTPQRDIMNRLSRNEFPKLIHEDALIYFRDVYDHLVRIEYLVEALRDLADGALQTYLSVVSNRLNEVMKVLTAAATVFLPMTVVTGIYGMNFEENQFPSFSADWGFAAVIIFMLVNSVLMLAYFRYRRWI